MSPRIGAATRIMRRDDRAGCGSLPSSRAVDTMMAFRAVGTRSPVPACNLAPAIDKGYLAPPAGSRTAVPLISSQAFPSRRVCYGREGPLLAKRVAPGHAAARHS